MTLAWEVVCLGGSEAPEHRWGHSLNCIQSTHLVVIGGLTAGKMYNDVHIFEICAFDESSCCERGVMFLPLRIHHHCDTWDGTLLSCGGIVLQPLVDGHRQKRQERHRLLDGATVPR